MATVVLQLMPEAAQVAASAFPAITRTAGTNFPVFGLAFDAAATERAYWRMKVVNYVSGGDVTLRWYADTATSGDVRWEIALAAITPDTDSQDVETKAFATAVASTDSHLGTTGQRVHSHNISFGANLDSVADGDEVWVRISRLGADGADTMTGDAIVIGATFNYTGA